MIFLWSEWWILGAGMQWQQWARIEAEGKVGIYDCRGKTILKAKYKNRFKAAASLRRRGFRKVRRKEIQMLSPPVPEQRGASRKIAGSK